MTIPEPCPCSEPADCCPEAPDPITDVDDFEVIGDIIRTAREHEHRFAAPVLSDTTEEEKTSDG